MLGVLLNFYHIPIKRQVPQFGFLVQSWDAINLIYQMVIGVL